MDFRTLLGTSKIILCDGAMGTMLYSKGVGLHVCFEEINLTNPSLIKNIHQEYIKAGAQIIETNTFGANRINLQRYALASKLKDINIQGVKIAREAKEINPDVIIAGSVGPIIGSITKTGRISEKIAFEVFFEQIQVLKEAGADVIILETFSQYEMLKIAIEAAVKVGDIPIIAQFSVNEEGRTAYGHKAEMIILELNKTPIDVIGINCSIGPSQMVEVIEKIIHLSNKPFSAQPNAGLPKRVEGRNIYMTTPEYMAQQAKRLLQLGVKIIGGCCGTTPSHIKAIKDIIKSVLPQRISIKTEEITSFQPQITPIEKCKKSRLAKKLCEGEFIRCVEITPPRGCDATKILEKARILHENNVDAVNIPDGPRASSRLSPLALAILIEMNTGIETILHYCCRDRNILGMQSDILGAYAAGLRNILVITGDPPKLGDYPDATAVFDVDSIGLVNIIKNLNMGIDIGKNRIDPPTGFFIGVGANPASSDLEREVERLFKKKEAGAEFVITQPIFDIKIFERFLKKIEALDLPIIAGVWPLTSYRNALFLNNEVPEVSIPPEIMKRMEKATSKEAATEEGILIAREILSALRNHIQGVQVSAPFGKVELALKVMF